MNASLDFEASMNRIDEIVLSLSEQLPLQQSLELFKEASGLIAFCSETLQQASATVEEYRGKLLSDEGDGADDL